MDKYFPVFTILGKSGSGKSTLLTQLLRNHSQHRRLVQYTTRPKRNNADNDYIFIDTKRSLFNIFTPIDNIIYNELKNDIIVSDIAYRVRDNDVWRYILTYDRSIIKYRDLFKNATIQDTDTLFEIMYSTTAASIGQFMDMYSYYMMTKYTEKVPIKPIPIVVKTDQLKRLKALYSRSINDDDSQYKEILRRELYGKELPDNYDKLFKDLGYTDDEIFEIYNDYENPFPMEDIVDFCNKVICNVLKDPFDEVFEKEEKS